MTHDPFPISWLAIDTSRLWKVEIWPWCWLLLSPNVVEKWMNGLLIYEVGPHGWRGYINNRYYLVDWQSGFGGRGIVAHYHVEMHRHGQKSVTFGLVLFGWDLTGGVMRKAQGEIPIWLVEHTDASLSLKPFFTRGRVVAAHVGVVVAADCMSFCCCHCWLLCVLVMVFFLSGPVRCWAVTFDAHILHF